MYRVRKSEEAIIRHYTSDDMKTPMHMSMGQEAIPVAVCHALSAGDQVFSTYRSHAVYLAQTQDTDKFFAELYGKVTGAARGKAGSMHLSAPEQGHLCSSAVVASCIPVAVGTAFANRSRKTGAVACVFFGDGAVDEGVFWESLNVASSMRIPVLFVCEDNGLAVHTPAGLRQGYRSVMEVVKQFNCDSDGDDSNDVEKIHEIAAQAIERIRKTGRPGFLRFTCYRYLEHVGVAEDFDAGYRARAEYEKWKARDSLDLQRRKLLERGNNESSLKLLESEILQAIDRSVERAQAAPFPGPEELYTGVFHEKH
jgi:pyruvate dehydrogenase E1 component alpha subunit